MLMWIFCGFCLSVPDSVVDCKIYGSDRPAALTPQKISDTPAKIFDKMPTPHFDYQTQM